MKLLFAIVLSAAAIFWGCTPKEPAVQQVQSGWHSYKNSRYGYEIRYPDGYDLWATGPERKQDGASIRIALKEYQAPTPVLDIKVDPRTPDEKFPALGMHVPQLNASAEKFLVHGMAAREVLYTWAENGDLAFAQLYLSGVVFEFTAPAGMREYHGTDWWAIICSFKFTK